MTTRTILVGKCKVIIDNVPPDASEDELYRLALQTITQANLNKAAKTIKKKYRPTE